MGKEIRDKKGGEEDMKREREIVQHDQVQGKIGQVRSG